MTTTTLCTLAITGRSEPDSDDQVDKDGDAKSKGGVTGNDEVDGNTEGNDKNEVANEDKEKSRDQQTSGALAGAEEYTDSNDKNGSHTSSETD